MTTLSQEELRYRLKALQHGPWSYSLREARKKLAPLSKLKVSIRSTSLIELDKIELSTLNRRKSSQLLRILRPHYEDQKGIKSPTEIETRDALDQALTLPELYELAVQTGYLPVEAVKLQARMLLADLLWSKAARGFVKNYDYIAVPMLATRVGVTGFWPVDPPQPNANSALRFAGFLAHLRAFYADDRIDVWTRFLDDYVQEDNEQYKLRRYLRGESKISPRRAQDLLNGCELFTASMANAFHVLDDSELGHFGLIHAYWLQKFFGYKMKDGSYLKDLEVWGKSDSWAMTIANSPHLIPETINSRIAGVFRKQFCEQLDLLKRTFNAVRVLAQSTRSNTFMPVNQTRESISRETEQGHSEFAK